MEKINELRTKYKAWSEGGAVGALVSGAVKVVLISILVFIVIYGLAMKNPPEEKTKASENSSLDNPTTQNESCTVKGIELHGSLLTYIPKHSDYDSTFNFDIVASQDIVWAIRQANKDLVTKAILIEVDSGGGSPVAGEEIANAIKNSAKPVVAIVRSMGASSSYWAITSADRIFASKNSDVGSIGITSSYLDNVEKNKKDGYTYEQISMGKYKDAGSPNKPLTPEEKALFLAENKVIYENFIQAVSDNRKIPIDKVRSIADGFTILGERAKTLGLVDEIGGINEVEKYLEQKIGEKPEICW